MTDCPHCGRTLGEERTSAVYADVRDTGDDGLRVDLAFVCDGCEQNIVIEDIPADEGLVGHLFLDDLSTFDGRGYHA